jgi:hypothetical protein
LARAATIGAGIHVRLELGKLVALYFVVQIKSYLAARLFASLHA